MAVGLISYPFRFTGGGAIAVVEQDSEAHITEELAMIVLTQPGERPLVPGFGLNDPTFDTVDRSSLAVQVEIYDIPADITDVQVEAVGPDRQDVIVYFE